MGDREPVVLARFKNGMSIDETNYADVAQAIMKKLSECKDQRGRTKPFEGLTTSKIRSIYSLIMNVYTRVDSSEDFGVHIKYIQYLKAKMAYEEGREPAVKTFMEGTRLRTLLNNVKDYDTFMLYCRYAESLVAYFKFFGGKDK